MAGESMGKILSEVENHILKITISNPSKRNAFDPDMMLQLSNALTELDVNPDLWVGVLTAEGEHFTAGLDMPKFFGPGANPTPIPEDNVSVFGLGKRAVSRSSPRCKALVSQLESRWHWQAI